jgi:hypothetical protein
MKPLSKNQRTVLQKMNSELTGFRHDRGVFYSKTHTGNIRFHSATCRSLINNGYMKQFPDGLEFYAITGKGKQALAKPTRNRGKKNKPDESVKLNRFIGTL